MQDYGPIFKEFRINRGFSLKQIACDDLSISQLSRFERGESNISLNKFLLALQTIQLSLDEFMNRANNYKKNWDRRNLCLKWLFTIIRRMLKAWRK